MTAVGLAAVVTACGGLWRRTDHRGTGGSAGRDPDTSFAGRAGAAQNAPADPIEGDPEAGGAGAGNIGVVAGGADTRSCMLPGCGDGWLDRTGKYNSPEECDDGGRTPGDGCSGTCRIEPGFMCLDPGVPCISTQICGDGSRTGSEVCDDGNTLAGDGCSAACDAVDRDVPATCGDGQLQGAEECDDGSNDGGYGECFPGCRLGPRCGDGVLQAPEQCDDGSNDGGYGECQPDCQLGPRCGDGWLQFQEGEMCDDGNQAPHDGCGPTCLFDTLVACPE
jgi:cysteine-rich repeat protein